MLKTKLPCSHLRHLGIEFPYIESPDISFDNAPECELIFEYDTNDLQFVQTNSDYFSSIRKYVSKIIKRYTHHKNKEEIMEFVEQ